jgi:FKBP-type peptidyl-prolyl cis-trans isomerase
MRLNLMKACAFAVGVLLAVPAMAQQKPAEKSAGDKQIFKSYTDRESYAMGVEMLRNLKRQDFQFDLEMLIYGLRDAAAGGQLNMTEDQILESLNVSASEARVRRTSDMLEKGEANKKAEAEFLADNSKKEGVVILPSGLQYKVLRSSEGKKPTAQDTVSVNYRGTVLNGAQFENTADAGGPATMNVSDPHVIAGLREALKLMPVGAKWQLFIPSRLAYGQRSAGKEVGPYSMLVYEMELLGIK